MEMCLDCGKEIRKISTRCKSCSNKFRHVSFASSKINLVCLQCKKDYKVFPSQNKSRFCSSFCWNGWKKENIRERVSLQCNQCSLNYEVIPSLKNKSNFCSGKCYGLWKSRNMVGKKNPLLSKIMKERHKKFGHPMSGKKLSKEHILILKKANSKPKSEEWKEKIGKIRIERNLSKGEKNPNFNNWSSLEPYDKLFNNQFKRAIRKRDNQICMACGIHREKVNRAFDIHHINGNKKMSIPQNCVSLCRSCHSKTNFHREHWVEFFQSILNKRYNYEYSQEGEIKLSLGEQDVHTSG